MTGKKQEKEQQQTNTTHRQQVRLVVSIGIAVVVIIGSLAGVTLAYAQKILPRTTLAGSNIGGQTADAINARVQNFREDVEADGIVFQYGGREVAVYPTVTSPDDPDITYELFSIDPTQTAAAAFYVGHQQSMVTKIKDVVLTLIAGRVVPVSHTVNGEALYTLLKENFGAVDRPAVNGTLVYADGAFAVTGENSGQVLDYEAALAALTERINDLSLEPIALNLVTQEPTVTYAEAQGMIGTALNALTLAPLTLTADEETSWEVNKDTLGNWLTVAKENNRPVLTIKNEPAIAFLNDKKKTYDVALQEGKFSLTNGRVSEFQPSQTGREIIIADSIKAIVTAVLRNKSNTATLVVTRTEPGNTTDEVNQLGIKELIGIGKSNFAGSPTNRRKNIALGAALLNGQLIQPDQEFSLVNALNHFNPADGWLPELVIKGNKTTPELGGGACQFGTTMFRAALNTGLPITERRNHSYTVRYYFPIGTDATIYDPSPDFKFKNDTGHAILIQTKIEGDDMIFEMWGTKDGRTSTITDPVLSNWVNPPEKKIIETTDLAPGQTKCTELAHKGVTARFDYHVTYTNGDVMNDTFTSVYKPWQEVCLVGVAPTAPTTETN